MVEINLVVKAEIFQIAVQVGTVSIVENHTHKEIAQHMVRDAKNVTKITTSRLYVKAVMLTLINVIQAGPDARKRVRARSSMKWLETMRWKILQIKSNFYSIMMYTSMVSTQE